MNKQEIPLQDTPDNSIETLRSQIKELEEETNYVESNEVLSVQKKIEQIQDKIIKLQKNNLETKIRPKNETNLEVDTVNNPFHGLALSSLPEYTQNNLKKFVGLLQEVSVPDWELYKIETSIKYGISVYGYYRKGDVNVKIRLSDHEGKNSEKNIDFRNPRDSTVISKYLKSRS